MFLHSMDDPQALPQKDMSDGRGEIASPSAEIRLGLFFVLKSTHDRT